MQEAGEGIRASSRSRVRLGVAALAAGAAALLFLALLPGPERRVYAGTDAGGLAIPADEQEYASPLEILLSPDGTRLYVLCQQSEDVRVLDAGSYKVIGTVAVGRVPRGMALSRAGDRLFVTNSWDDTVSVIDTRTLEVVAIWPVGAEPSGVVEDAAGKYVLCCQPNLQRHRRSECADGR
jgi:YVTN family beta-propeller protein